MDVWATALASVDCAVNPWGNLLNSGLSFPDPFQLIWVEGGDRFARYIANWLMIRQAWVRAVAAGRVGYPPYKLWQEILNGLPQFTTRTNQEDPAYAGYCQISWLLPPPWDEGLTLMKQSKKCRANRQATLDFLGESSNEFQVLQRQVPEQLHFHDCSWQIEWVHGGMTPDDVQVVFWKLMELSMRYELLLVDHVLTTQLRANPAVYTKREQLVCSVFDTTSLDTVIHDPWPGIGVGLASSDPRRRWGRLSHLVSLMSSWPGVPTLILPTATDPRYLKAEQRVLTYCLQTLYQFFDRCPTVP